MSRIMIAGAGPVFVTVAVTVTGPVSVTATVTVAGPVSVAVAVTVAGPVSVAVAVLKCLLESFALKKRGSTPAGKHHGREEDRNRRPRSALTGADSLREEDDGAGGVIRNTPTDSKPSLEL